MQEVDFCLSLDRVHTVWMKNLVGIEGGKIRRNVPCVGMSVRMWVMCYGSVQHIAVLELALWRIFKSC